MKRYFIFLGLISLAACKLNTKEIINAQTIVDKSIEVCGGKLYENTIRVFTFRDKIYSSENKGGIQILKRISENDSNTVIDVRTNQNFERFINNFPVSVPDSMAIKYSNSINSVHYFANLPWGLNAKAVVKELLGKVVLNGKEYYKVKITFEEKDGGEDFDDTYVYWFNTETWKPDFLAYEFHTEGGGMRFRSAYNERYINGIRFVDYKNYKTKNLNTSIFNIDSLYTNNSLVFLSKIELTDIKVNQGNYN